ncbi:MAG: DUF808 domain-containing protein [Coriobacteriia bacterium]|nr:DUF808 domain-containing protein [Coriobacteriia bacterium]MCL2537807.1 DUF808 domain-containing protein [Coriobacteriia bacterium]
MSVGLLSLLDDIAAIAKLAAASIDDVGSAAGKATAKAAGVVVDDTAVTPQYVQGVAAEREIPIVQKIALGSLRNKLLIIMPLALALSQWAPWVLPWILIAGGSFLAYEGAEKVWKRFTGHEDHTAIAAAQGPEAEKALVGGAVRTDLILSTEIMLIALATIVTEGQSFWAQLVILVIVALVMTAGVYGFVALLVKMDDAGLYLVEHARTRGVRTLGTGMVNAMPRLMQVISLAGTAAMLWVGGHILLQNLASVGWTWPWDAVEQTVHLVHVAIPWVEGSVGWLIETLLCAVVGLTVGTVVLALVDFYQHHRDRAAVHSA